MPASIIPGATICYGSLSSRALIDDISRPSSTLLSPVTHSLSLPFLSSSANNLVVAKSSLLQIFSLKSVITHNHDGITTPDTVKIRNSIANGPTSHPDSTRGDRLQSTRLVLIAQYELSGTVTSLARVKILQSKSGGEALLVGLRDAKLSLVEWDPERFSVSTISIHYYEREDILSNPWEPDLGQCQNYLCVDPSSRCAAFKFGRRHLAILPFHQIGDDLIMDDYDPEIDGERPEKKASTSKPTADGATAGELPYDASFVLSLMALDPSLSHPIHLSFLYEYREPTFGVLYSQVASSIALLHERRDNVSYAVYTLDLEQRASTTLLSVNNLPYDLFAVMPLSRPIGGALLVGGNEIIHVDQSGKANGVAVNEFAKQSTTFAMADQTDLNMRLEHSIIQQLGQDNAELLIILNTGQLAILSFKIDGRSVSGLLIRRVTTENGGATILAGPSCASIVGRGRIFIGSEDSDSIVLGWSRKADRLKRKRLRSNIVIDDDKDALEIDEEEIEDDEDDLYTDNKPEEKVPERAIFSDADLDEDYRFRVHDSMLNVGPMTDMVLRNSSNDVASSHVSKPSTDLLTTSGRGRYGGLTVFQPDVRLDAVEQINVDKVRGIWSVRSRQSQENALKSDPNEAFDKYIFTSALAESGELKPAAYIIKPAGLEEIRDTEFDPDAGNIVDVGTINGGSRIVQVSQSEVRTYDEDFGLAQIFPLTDEESDAEPAKVVSASFADPYVLLVRDDFSAILLTEDESGDLDEVPRGEAFRKGKWFSGSLFEDSNDVLRLEYPEDSDDEAGNVLLFLLSAVGGLQIFRLPNLNKPVYIADGLSFLPPFLSSDFTIRRSSARETLCEILMTELGDSTHKSPYLILRSANDDLIIYQPYQSYIEGSRDTALRFLKIPNPHVPRGSTEPLLQEQQKLSPLLQSLHDVGGFSAVFMAGTSPAFIIKSASCPPYVIGICEASVKSCTSIHTPSCHKGVVYIDGEGKTWAAQLPLQVQYDTGWVTKRVPFGEEVIALTYHEEKDAYIIGTGTTVDFKLPEDEFHSQWSLEETAFFPQIEQGSIKLLDGKSLTIIGEYPLEPYEVVTIVKTVSLVISEHTHERQNLVAVGTAVIRGEDLASMGYIYIFAVIDVVPEPDHAETGRALKLITKEKVKGAVTALSAIGTQGFLLAAEGQKCMVRGLKEDGSFLPVAFMDMQCYVSVAKELPETGLVLMCDAVKGVWFTGYTEEPYTLRLFGKSPHHLEVIAADFLPDGKQLYIVVADADCNIHIMQFDPEHPKTLSGQRLFHHTTFHTSQYPSTLTLLPSTAHANSIDSSPPPSPILLTTTTGALALLTPLPPSAHRTLSALQSHLQNTLPHPLGLNPRAFRLPSAGNKGVAEGVGIGRGGIVDGEVVKRWREGGRWRWWGGKEQGGEGEEVRGLVRSILGGGVLF